MSHVRAVIGVVVLGVATLIGLVILGQIGAVALNMAISAADEEIRYHDADETYTLDENVDERPPIIDVSPSMEYAVQLDGDGYVDGGVEDGWTDGDWTICATGQLQDDANPNATYNLFAHDNETVILEYSDGEWKGYHYDDGESGEVSISAGDVTDGYESVCVGWDWTAEELTITDGEQNDTAALDSDSPDRSVANNWYGSIDEVRILTSAPDEQRAATYAEDPIDPLADANHEARWMFNEGEDSETFVYYSNQSATISGGEWTDGVDAPELEEETDYQLGFDPLTVTVVSGGYLDGAPTVFASWETGVGATLAAVLSGTGSALELVPVLMLVIMAGIVVGVVARMRH